MPIDLSPFADAGLDRPTLDALLDDHRAHGAPTLDRLWRYYRNPALLQRDPRTGAFRTRLAQAAGLPARLTRPLPDDDRHHAEREIVIENDIAWRLHALLDLMLGRPPVLLSNSPDPDTRAAVQDVLDAVFENAGGIGLLQDAALLASVFGHVDFLLRTDALFAAPIPTSARNDPRAALDFAHLLRLEVIEPTRAVPLLDPDDFRRLSAYLIHFTRPETPASTARSRTTSDADASTARTGFLAALRERIVPASGPSAADTGVLEIFTAAHHQRYEDGRLVIDSPNTLGALPVVHIQNLAQPFRYQGLSEVEPLIPLQDELNTRLSDRANRVTLQSFKLLLAKGLDDDAPVRSISPGQVWLTSNPDASIQAFGGDAASPSEDNHIQQIREAMDKASAVNALAAGLIRARVGQLSSENALRITLLGALKKTTRKQVAFGKGLARLAELILLALDRAGLFPTGPADRAVTVQWPDPIPRNERDRLEAARLKVQLGVPRERVLAELGYSPNDAAIT